MPQFCAEQPSSTSGCPPGARCDRDAHQPSGGRGPPDLGGRCTRRACGQDDPMSRTRQSAISLCPRPRRRSAAPPAMASLAVAAMAASASLAPPASASFSLRPVRLPHASACPLRLRLPLRPARCLPRILVRASQSAPTPQEDLTFAVIQDIIAEQLAVKKDTIKPDSKFAELGADSLDTVEIMMALEEKFEIHLEQEAGEKIQTVSDAVDLIKVVIASK